MHINKLSYGFNFFILAKSAEMAQNFVDNLSKSFSFKLHLSNESQNQAQYAKKIVKPLELDTPLNPNKIRVVCISDTHSKCYKMTHKIPDADILIHAGDFTRRGNFEEIDEFNKFLDSLNKIKYKVVIAGNHELSFDPKTAKHKNDVESAKNKLKNCIYLEDSSVEILGLKIYGSPWQPVHVDNAFQLSRGAALLEKWNKIPNNVDILVTHGPPLGYGDRVHLVNHVGCADLLQTVKNRVKPKFHVFGHVHEDHGCWTDGTTTFINACICDSGYKPINKPVLFDIDKPES